MGIQTIRGVLLGSVMCCTPILAAHAQLAETENSGNDTNELANDKNVIIVTAQKRSERLTDVPMSITAVTGEQLAVAGVSDTSQLVKAVPGFSYQKGAFGTPVLSIRGIGYSDNSVAAGPAVTSYVDQVALPYSVMARGAFLDLERVEVLKGPQGTLFGMNSTGGAINFIAARPTSHLEAGFNAGFARFSEVDLSAFISGPLGDTLTARAAVQFERADGWQRSSTRPNDRLGSKEFYNGRLLLDWQAADMLTLQLSLSAWHDSSETQAAQFLQFSPAVPVTPITQFIADAMNASPVAAANARSADWDPGRNYKRDDDFFQVSLRADWELSDDVLLTSLTSYSDFRGNAPIDIDGSAFTAFAVTSHPAKLTSFAQELRLSGTSGPVDWMVGGNYQDEVANESTLTLNQGTNNQIGPFLFTALGQVADQDIVTSSVFGSIDVNLTDALTLQGSARYTDQNRDFSGCIRDAGLGPTGTTAAEAFGFLASNFTGTPVIIPPGGCLSLDAATFQPGLVTSELDEDNLSWRVGLDYKIAADSILYANVTRGYKSGSYALVPGILSSQFTPVTQESVLAFEAGMRVSTLDGLLNFDAAVFYGDYKDKQLKGIVLTPVFGPLPQLINIPKSEIYGFEFNMVARPADGLRLSAGLTHVRSKVRADPLAPSEPRGPFGNLTTYVGEQFPNTPKWQAIADAEYKFPLNNGGLMGMVGTSVNHRSGSPAQFGEDPLFVLPSYTLLDLRAGVETEDGRWSAQIWGRNITNDYYWTNVTHLTDYVSRLAGMPATYGISIGYRY